LKPATSAMTKDDAADVDVMGSTNGNSARSFRLPPKPPLAPSILAVRVLHGNTDSVRARAPAELRPQATCDRQALSAAATITAAAYLRSLGHEVALFDPMLDDDTRGFGPALARFRPDVVVIYDDVFNWFTKMCLGRMREAALGMIAVARTAGARVIVSGHDAADAPELYLNAGAHAVAVGEAEITLGELLARMDAPADIPGLVFRDRGLVRRTRPRTLLKELDTLPLAAWDLVDVERYRAFWRARHGYFSLNVNTTRGCPYKCNWCSKPVYGNTYHTRTPENVVAEIKMLRELHAPDRLWFCDDIFGLKARWLIPFSEQIAAQGLALPFLCQTRADLMTAENVAALKRAGCAETWMGVESGAQTVLDAMDKGLTLGHVRGAVERLRAAGIRIGFFLQFGYPGEGWREIEMTRDLVRELTPDDIGISVSYSPAGDALPRERQGAARREAELDREQRPRPPVPGVVFYRLLPTAF
jgi:anaerobic magnesium-protoporphyrin IX monomethyl ester cyclase